MLKSLSIAALLLLMGCARFDEAKERAGCQKVYPNDQVAAEKCFETEIPEKHAAENLQEGAHLDQDAGEKRETETSNRAVKAIGSSRAEAGEKADEHAMIEGAANAKDPDRANRSGN